MTKRMQIGGDGYVVNVEEAIGGLPAYSRYSNNYRPVFEGDLLQNGGGKNEKNEILVYDLIKLNGGNKDTKVTQFDSIKEVSYLLSNLSEEQLTSITSNIFLKHLADTNSTKFKQLGGYIHNFQHILAPLGKNNLIVLTSLLLLHHFAVESNSKTLSGGGSGEGNNDLLSSFGISHVMSILHDAFNFSKKTTNKSNLMKGGNPLKDLIAPLGTKAFIATGLLVILQKMFTNKVNEIKKNNKVLVGGKPNKKFEMLFNVLAPIAFNTFATDTFLEKMAPNKLKK